MPTKFILIAIIACFVFTIAVKAQPLYNVWFRGTASHSLNKQWKLDAELQHRRQCGYNNHCPLDKNLVYSFRTWIHYQYNSTLKLSVSPFAFFQHYRIIRKESDEDAKPVNETRFSIAAELQPALNKHFLLVQRTAIEYRMLANNIKDITRCRNKLGLRYSYSSFLQLTVFDELFMNIHGASKSHFFDHNRLGASVECKLASAVKVEATYLYVDRLPLNSSNMLTENNGMIHVSWQF